MLKIVIFGSLFLALVAGESVRILKCEEQSADKCTISNVQINPCPEADEDLPCRVKRGKKVGIQFDLKPDFDIETLDSRVYWANGNMDLPLVGIDINGCNFIDCPVQQSSSRTYAWNFEVLKKFPIRQFDVKMKLTNQDGNFCCFIFKIKLTK